MKPRELAQVMMATAALLTAAGSVIKQIRGETAQAVQDQNVAEFAGQLGERIAAVEAQCKAKP